MFTFLFTLLVYSMVKEGMIWQIYELYSHDVLGKNTTMESPTW